MEDDTKEREDEGHQEIPKIILKEGSATMFRNDWYEQQRASFAPEFEDEEIPQVHFSDSGNELMSDVTSEGDALLSHQDFAAPETPPYLREREEIERWEMSFQQSLFKHEVFNERLLMNVSDNLEHPEEPENQRSAGQRKHTPIFVVDTNFPDSWVAPREVHSGIPSPQNQLEVRESLLDFENQEPTSTTGWNTDSELKSPEKKPLYLIDTGLPETWTKPLEIKNIKDLEGIGSLAQRKLLLGDRKVQELVNIVTVPAHCSQLPLIVIRKGSEEIYQDVARWLLPRH
ncbi:uncharacterized protein LOC122551912 [Chiloscyllium plagiosum]|uniref:uncharacterized protein LOC122551912 n=1 Tax=Chiloscyllium plagiosum TaxID=36176 RepID=UPI001CB80227|nr:uncharacterized protein LOC122551912 [Chiloscyllium plagiosum]